jgi:chemotaxis protein histidine kinase CheA
MHLGDYQVEASSCEVWGHVRWHEVALPGQTTEPTHVPDPTTPVAQSHTALPPAAAAAAAAEAEPAAKATAAAAEAEPAAKATAAAAQNESAAKATAAAAQDESAATAAPAPAPSPPLQAGGALFGSQTLACLLVVCVFLVPQLLIGRRRRLNSLKRQRAFLLA